MMRFLGFLLVASFLATTSFAVPVRLKDLVEFEGVRTNDLVGYGLVVGLSGTGDGLRNAPFTEDILANILERLGVNVTGEQFGSRNVAAVLVTATLPPFARSGANIDVTVSAIGDAKSLLGGTLIMTPLKAADGEIYAVAQGTIIAGGISAAGAAAEVSSGVPTAGSIPSGATVEREVNFDFSTLRNMRLALRTPDFTTAIRIEEKINTTLGAQAARLLDAGTVELDLTRAAQRSPAHTIARIESIEIDPDQRARVVVDQRSGTIVMGENVRVERVAVSQGNLTLRIQEAPLAVQPNPFADGETVIVPRTGVQIDEEAGTGLVDLGEGATLSDVVQGLNSLGVRPRDMIDILKSIHASGGLHAELIIY